MHHDKKLYRGILFFVMMLLSLRGYSQLSDIETWIRGVPYDCVQGTEPSFIKSVAYGNTVYIAFKDANYGNKLSVRKFDGTNWSYVGTPGISASEIWDLDLIVGDDGILYVGYPETDLSYRGSVQKFNGTSWSHVGPVGFTPDYAAAIDMCFDQSGKLLFSFMDEFAVGYKASVMIYDTSWTFLGARAFSPAAASYMSICTHPINGEIYLAFQDNAYGNKVSVMKYDGSSWLPVGNYGFSPGICNFLDLAIDTTGKPFLGFTSEYSSTVTTWVYYFDGIDWMSTSSDSLAGYTYDISLSFDKNGRLYTCYSDQGCGTRIRVKWFNGTEWIQSGHGCSGWIGEYNPTISVLDDNTMYMISNNLDYNVGHVYKMLRQPGGIYSGGFIGNPVIVLENAENIEVKIYPNPVTENLMIATDILKNGTLNIFDMTGRLIINSKMNKSLNQIDVSALANGVYMIKIEYENKSITRKIVKR